MSRSRRFILAPRSRLHDQMRTRASPAKTHTGRARPGCTMLLMASSVAVTWWMSQDARADDGQTWAHELSRQFTSPLFWFGMVAQFLFFLRFIWQWMVSERRKRSTIPVIFWWFSLAGGVAMFVYGWLRPDLVIMLGQLLACLIYARNLTLIYGRAARRRAGLPVDLMNSETGNGQNDPAEP